MKIICHSLIAWYLKKLWVTRSYLKIWTDESYLDLVKKFSLLSDFIFISLSLKLYLYLRAPQTLSRSRLFCEHSGVINWVIIRRRWITYGFHVLALPTEQLKDSWEEIFDWILRLSKSFNFSSASFLSDWRSGEWNWKPTVLCSLIPQYFSSARLLYVFHFFFHFFPEFIPNFTKVYI